MQLIPEEVAYLRERGESLENKCANFYQDRYDHDNINGVKIPSMDDINEKGYQFYSNSLKDIHHLLTNNQFVWKRNFDKIDVGTGFFLCFDDDPEIKRYVLTEKGFALSSSYKLISLESDLGNAVKGKKDGDKITYQVSKTLRTISASIIKIDRVKHH